MRTTKSRTFRTHTFSVLLVILVVSIARSKGSLAQNGTIRCALKTISELAYRHLYDFNSMVDQYTMKNYENRLFRQLEVDYLPKYPTFMLYGLKSVRDIAKPEKCSDLEPFVVDTVHRLARLATLLIYLEQKEPVFLANPLLFLVYTSSVDLTHRIAHASLTNCDINNHLDIRTKELSFVILREYRDQMLRITAGIRELLQICQF